MQSLEKLLAPQSITPGLQCRTHQASLTKSDQPIPTTGNADWQVVAEKTEDLASALPGQEWMFTLRREGDTIENTSIALSFDFAQWSTEHYVFMPAAAYAGNRFESRAIPYPPILDDAADIGPDTPPIITDVPRLNNQAGHSQLVQLTRDCTTPMVAVFDPASKKAFFLVCPHATRFGDSGLEVEESDDRASARISLRAPGIRPETRYSFCSTTSVESPDRGIAFPKGLNLTLRVQVYAGDCADMRTFYAQFFDLRNALSGERTFKHDATFSESWKILEDKYNRENWYPEGGYYRVGSYDDSPSIYQDWQTGWVGGLQSTLAQLALGDKTTQERATATIDFALSKLTSSSGYLWGGYSEGELFGDHFRDPQLPWVMTRKNGDALYFLLKQCDLLKKQSPDWSAPEHWQAALRGIADAFCRTWDSQGQFGQLVDLETGTITVGGSCAAGVVPGALAEASRWFNEPRYLKVAEQSARALVESFAEKGYTLGGPGEILQCPDSESAFGLLESLVVLHEITGKAEWCKDAEFLAQQCASWCVTYDYPFPPESEFGRLDLRSRGSVWASVQNKHSAPGICTFSGDALLKLYRATGDLRYLDLLQEIAHNITQYLSRADRPIRGFQVTDVGNYATMHDTPAGWMSERVQLSDFSEPTGEIFAGSCWCETSTMLTIWEVPGLYILPDAGRVIAFDHIETEVLDADPAKFTVRLHNPTAYPAEVRILCERSDDLKKPLGQNALHNAQSQMLASGERVTLTFD